MRLLAVHPGAHFSVADVHNGWVEALRGQGVKVGNFNLGDRLQFYTGAQVERDGKIGPALSEAAAVHLATQGLLAACYEYAPDVVLITSCFFIAPSMLDLIRIRGSKVVLLHTESPYEDDRQLERASHADLNLLNDPTNIDRFRKEAPSHYLPHAYRMRLHYPRPPDPVIASEFVFVGTGYPSRIQFLEQVDWTGIDAALAGNWQGLAEDSPLRSMLAHEPDRCCDNTDTVGLYTSAKVSANLYRREADRPELSQGWAMGPREVELAACGTFFLREPRGEGDELLPMLPTFTSPEEFEDSLRWWLAHDTQRQDAALKAREAVADRTFDNNASALLRLLNA